MNTRSSTITLPFRNRSEAGRMLASRLADYCGRPDVIVLGLPRGGVPVAYEVAQELVLLWCRGPMSMAAVFGPPPGPPGTTA